MKTQVILLSVSMVMALTGCFSPSGSESSGNSSYDAITSDTATVASRAASDPEVDKAARQLVTDYLESQKRGEDSSRFGNGATSFYNLTEYNLEGFGRNMVGHPCFFAKVKAGNKGGGSPTWGTAWIYLRQSSGSSSYGGLEISMVYIRQ